MDNLKQEKKKMWTENLAQLQKDYQETMVKRGLAAQEGDLKENAAYELLTEHAQVISAQIRNVRKILSDLELTV